MAIGSGRLEVEGVTASGRHVKVTSDGEGSYGGRYTVTIDGVLADVIRVGRYRDGGTTYLDLEIMGPDGNDNARILFPHRLGSDDRTPKLDGEDILPLPPGGGVRDQRHNAGSSASERVIDHGVQLADEESFPVTYTGWAQVRGVPATRRVGKERYLRTRARIDSWCLARKVRGSGT